MQEDWRINGRQFGLLVFLYSIGTTILITVNTLADAAGQDAWASVALGMGISILLVWLYTSLAKLYPDSGLVEFTVSALGKWLGRAVCLSMVVFFFIGSVSTLYIVGNFSRTLMMPETPIVFINILFTAVVVMGARLGIETIARSAEILFPLVLFFIIFLVLFSSPELDIENLIPILGADIGSIAKGTFMFVGVFSLPQVVLMMIFPYCLNRGGKGGRAFFVGMLAGGAAILIIEIYCITVLGADYTAQSVFPAYTLAKKISIDEIIERVEAIIAGLWIITIFYKTVLYFYAAVLGLSKALGLRDNRPLTLPMGMLAVTVSLILYPDVSYAMMWDARVWLPFALVHGLFIPLFILVAGLVKKKRASKLSR